MKSNYDKQGKRENYRNLPYRDGHLGRVKVQHYPRRIIDEGSHATSLVSRIFMGFNNQCESSSSGKYAKHRIKNLKNSVFKRLAKHIKKYNINFQDFCGNVLQYDMIAEIKLNKFVSKDKTKPFRKARDYQSIKAYYRLFT